MRVVGPRHRRTRADPGANSAEEGRIRPGETGYGRRKSDIVARRPTRRGGDGNNVRARRSPDTDSGAIPLDRKSVV